MRYAIYTKACTGRIVFDINEWPLNEAEFWFKIQKAMCMPGDTVVLYDRCLSKKLDEHKAGGIT